MDIREGLLKILDNGCCEDIPDEICAKHPINCDYCYADQIIDYLTEQGVGVMKRYTAVDPGFSMERAQETALTSSERFISLKEYIEKHG